MDCNDSVVDIYNDNAITAQLPGIIFVSVQILCGFSTNAIFLLTYLHMKVKNQCGSIVYYELLMYLCMLDIATCLITMPVDVIQQRYMFTLLNEVGCKVQNYVKCVLITASVVMTLVIAVHRYRKISSPLGRHMTFKTARCVFGVVVLGSMVLHVPIIMIAGQETIYNVPQFKFCGIGDELKDSMEVRVFFYVWISVFCLLTLITVALYGAIGIHIHKKETRELGSPTSTTSTFFRPTSEVHHEMTAKDKTETSDGKMHLRSISLLRNETQLSGDARLLISVGEKINISQKDSKQLQSNDSNMSEAKTFIRCKTMPKDYRPQMLEKTHNNRPRSQELLSALRTGPSYTRRTRSFGNINDLNITTLRTKQQQQRKQRHDDILRVGMLISLTYFLSLVPFSVALPMVLYREKGGDEAVDIFVHLGVRSLYLRPALNPLLYGLFDTRLRRFFVQVFKRLKETLRLC